MLSRIIFILLSTPESKDGPLTDILYLMTQAYTALRVLIVESRSIPSLEFR